CDVVRAGEEACRVHHRRGAEQNPVPVDEEHAAVRGECAENLRGAETTGHAIEHDRGAAGLVEAHALSGADIERTPVDDRAAARLTDDDGGGTLTLNSRRAADHCGAFGAGRSRRRRERDERRGRQYESAKTWMHRNSTATVRATPFSLKHPI